MKRPSHHLLLGTLLMLVLALTACSDSQKERRRLSYTKERPLIFLADKEFPPYEYIDEKGRSKGLYIDLTKKVMERLGVPYVIKHEDFVKLGNDFMNGQGDLIIDLAEEFEGDDIYYGSNIVTYYGLAFAMLKQNPDIHSLGEIDSTATIGIKPRNYALYYLDKKHFPLERVTQSTPRFGLEAVVAGQATYYLWGEEPLQRTIGSQGYRQLKTCRLDAAMPDTRFIGHDQQLMEQIDIEFARLEREGYVKELREKWLGGNNDAPNPWIVIALSTLLAAVVVGLLSYAANHRIKRARARASELNDIMVSALGQGNLVTVFNAADQRLRNLMGNLLPAEGLTGEEVVAHTHPDDFESAMKGRMEIENGAETSRSIFRWNVGSEQEPRWVTFRNMSLAERDKKGRIVNIFNTLYDITEQSQRQEKVREQDAIFSQIYQQSRLGLAFFDRQGHLIEMNPRMSDIMSQIADVDMIKDNNLYDHPPVKGVLELGNSDIFHVCHLYHRKDGQGDIALEMRYFPSILNGELLFIGLSVNDMTEEHNVYHSLAANDRRAKQANREINDYADRFNHLLRSTDMTYWRSSRESGRYFVTKDITNMAHGMTYDEFGMLMHEDSRQIWDKQIRPLLENDSEKPISAVLHARYNAIRSEETWMAISGTPEHDEQGRKTGYFGISIDVTEIMKIREQLKKEEQQAKNSGQVKSVFLANLSHEIRTPLNSIVGFSELLETAETDEDKQNFVRIIQNNCDMLLRLIDDILDLSAMDSNALVMRPEKADFSKAFDDICQSLRQRVTNPNVEFVKINPFSTFITQLDMGRIQQVITNFVTNAIKYTKQGHIKVGYRYTAAPDATDKLNSQRGLYIYCEDTGAGIPKEQCPTVFDRFVKLNDHVQGTGLGLSICRAIAEKSGGQIGVKSDIGQGSTFWIWVPCQEIY